MIQAAVPLALMRRLPFFYGWIILACACAAAIARGGPAVATMSIFVEPMTREFGWSRTAMSGAVSLGGVLAAISSPMVGALLDRSGARAILCAAVLTTGVTLAALSQIHSLLAFYLLFCIARLNFAGPFDIGIYGAINSWFVARRAFASSIVAVTQLAGLIVVPLVGHVVMQHADWRSAWVVIGVLVLVVGLIPNWLLMVRRPEDMGLAPDGAIAASDAPDKGAAASATPVPPEPAFTRAQALRTRAFWMLSLFVLMAYPIQAGMSLHQAAHLIECGLSPTAAVSAVAIFSLGTAISAVAFGNAGRWISVRMALAISGVLLSASALVTAIVTTPLMGTMSAILFGFGLGALQTVLPVAWADYFGRKNFGAIRGVALTFQVTAQACGPLLSGVLRDWTGTYVVSLIVFAGLGLLAAMAALLIRQPSFDDGGETSLASPHDLPPQEKTS